MSYEPGRVGLESPMSPKKEEDIECPMSPEGRTLNVP